ncbi:MAG: alpha/beta hydrolase [Polyangiaceae bacterium]
MSAASTPNPRALLGLASSAARVAARRARFGPRRPSWTFGFEALVEGLRSTRQRTGRLPIVEQRRAWDELAMPSPARAAVQFTQAPEFSIPSTWCHARARSEGGPVVLFLHGGAYNFGSLATYGDFIARLALASGARVLFVDYRLAPEHPFPAALDDASTVYDELTRSVDPRRIVIAGDSAGGGLTIATLVRLRDRRAPLPSGAILVAPWVDLVDENHDEDPDDWITGAWGAAFGDAYRAGKPKDHPEISPARADLRGLPRMLVQIGTADLLHPQVSSFVSVLRAADVPVEVEEARDMVHDWHFFAPVHAPSRAPFESMGRFVRASTAGLRAG